MLHESDVNFVVCLYVLFITLLSNAFPRGSRNINRFGVQHSIRNDRARSIALALYSDPILVFMK